MGIPRRRRGVHAGLPGALSSFRSVFIDAGTGEELFEVSGIREQTIGLGTGLLGDTRKMSTESIGGTYRTRDQARPALIRTLDMEYDENRFLNSLLAAFNGVPSSLEDLADDEDNQWEDGAVVDVHAGLGWSYDYLATQLDWNGIDGAGNAITAFVHPMNPARVLSSFEQCVATATDPFEECIVYVILVGMIDNAVYFQPFPGAPGSTGFMVFGEPLEFLTTPLTALDVVAHEMAHGVTHFTAGLGYTPPPNEPGAIDEAFSDIIGTATEFYVQEAGDEPLRADYLMGEDTDSPSDPCGTRRSCATGSPVRTPTTTTTCSAAKRTTAASTSTPPYSGTPTFWPSRAAPIAPPA